MANPRSLRFAVQTYRACSANEWREKARRAEALGYSDRQLADRLDPLSSPWVAEGVVGAWLEILDQLRGLVVAP